MFFEHMSDGLWNFSIRNIMIKWNKVSYEFSYEEVKSGT